jgi:hypothetical protein
VCERHVALAPADRAPYTLHPQPDNPQPSTRLTLNPTPYTLHPTPDTLNRAPYTLRPQPSTLNPQP